MYCLFFILGLTMIILLMLSRSVSMKNHRQNSNGENSFTDTFCSWLGHLKGTCMISPCPLSRMQNFKKKILSWSFLQVIISPPAESEKNWQSAAHLNVFSTKCRWSLGFGSLLYMLIFSYPIFSFLQYWQSFLQKLILFLYCLSKSVVFFQCLQKRI